MSRRRSHNMSRKHFAECEGKTLLVKSCHEIRIPSLNQDDRRLQQLPILHCAHLKSRNQRMRRHLLILLVVPFSTTQILKFFDDTNIEENDEENEITGEEEFQLFDAVSGNSSTEEKGAVDDDNLLQY